MKKFNIVLLLCMSVSLLHAQHVINPFFAEDGSVRLETQELQHDTIVSVFHRAEDVVWHRTVYSIIDLRYKQNYELYFPASYDNPRYKSFFGVMLQALIGGAPVYSKSTSSITPTIFDESLLLTKKDLAENAAFYVDGDESKRLLTYYPETDALGVEEKTYYEDFVADQFKFLIQEVIFFDKHYSRLFRQIVAIAPMYAPLGGENVDDPYQAIINEIMFWMSFKDLRPYMKNQYIISSRNSSKRITFDRFFQQRLYTSYIVGEDNVYDRIIPEYVRTEEQIKKEQARIENELLTFEQDLWEN